MTGVWKLGFFKNFVYINQEGVAQEISSGTFRLWAALLGSKTTLNYYFNEKALI